MEKGTLKDIYDQYIYEYNNKVERRDKMEHRYVFTF